MGDVGGITNQNMYRDRDLDDLKDNEKVSTNAAINRIANHAGASEIHVLHGIDKTEGQIREAHGRTSGIEHGFGVVEEIVNMGGEHFVEHTIEHAAMAGGQAAIAGLMLPATLVKAQLEMMHAVGEDGIVGHERAEAMPRDAMHVMILGNLNGLPKGYADAERARFSNDAKDGSFTRAMNAQLGLNDNAMMAIMQLHCDQGMNAARAAFEAKQTPSEYLASHPDVASRYERDPAFHHGFNGMAFAHDNGQYAEMVKELDARDARYDAHNVAWRG